MAVAVKQVIQLIPAAGWYAKYKIEERNFEYTPLIAFALVEETDRDGALRYVDGIDCDGLGETELVKGVSNFVTFIHESELERDRARSSAI